MYQALFFLFAAAALGFGVNLLLQRHPIYSALSLIGVMASLASLYMMLGAEFIAAVQIIVYAGAIMVLFVFVIMLLNAGEEDVTDKGKIVKAVGPVMGVVLAAILSKIVLRQMPQDAVARFGDFGGHTALIGRLLFREFLLPFEIVSVLILIAIVGAVVLARKEI